MTDRQKYISRKYLTYKLLTHMWFLGAVWLYFYRLYITDQQVGILDGSTFAIGLLAEVPSGAIADKFGRDRTVRIGWLTIGLGLIVQALGTSFPPLFIGQAIVMIGLALVSGADEALFFENLKFKRDSVEWRKLVTRGSQYALMGSIFALVIGGGLHTIDPRLPWLMTALAFICSVFVIWDIKDSRITSKAKSIKEDFDDYINNIKIGFKEFTKPDLKVYVPIILIVQGLFYVNGYGLLRIILLDRFEFSPFLGSIAVAASSLITVGILGYMHKNAEKISEKNVITIISLLALSSLMLALANIGNWGFVVILSLYAGEHVLSPFMSEILNYHSPEKQRATVLSVGSFLKILPYVILAPIIGYLSTNDSIEIFLIGWSILIVLALLIYLRNKPKDEYVNSEVINDIDDPAF